MKIVFSGNILNSPYEMFVPENNSNVLDFVLNDFRQALECPSYPQVLAYRVWGHVFTFRGRTMYDIWEEYAIGAIEKQKYFKNEYLGRVM
jgi:hypothetical protein